MGVDGRPVGSDGLQTFGGVRALARYVKVVAMPAVGGRVVINEVSIFYCRFFFDFWDCLRLQDFVRAP